MNPSEYEILGAFILGAAREAESQFTSSTDERRAAAGRSFINSLRDMGIGFSFATLPPGFPPGELRTPPRRISVPRPGSERQASVPRPGEDAKCPPGLYSRFAEMCDEEKVS